MTTARPNLWRCAIPWPHLAVVLAALVMPCADRVWSQTNDEAPDDSRPPNIVLIMIDDLGKEWLGCYGADDIATPHFDQLAARGMRFDNAYAMPQCTPTRTTLLTGRYPFHTGWVNHWDVPRWGVAYFDPNEPVNYTFARPLREQGYRTCIAGKWQINDFRIEPKVLDEHGFEDWCVWTGYETGNPASAERYQDAYIHTPRGSETRLGVFGPDAYCDYLIDFMNQHRSEPFCLYYPMALTHTPLVATPDEPHAESRIEKHRAMVRYADRLIGRIVAEIDRLGLRDQTYILVTTDNGSTNGIVGSRNGRRIPGAKAQENEAGTCMPLIVSAPSRVAEGSSTDALVDFTDLFPTFLELAEHPSASVSRERYQIDGHSFAPVLSGADPRGPRDWILSMGHGPARLDEQGVRGRDDFATRVMRDRRFKVWVDRDRRIVRLHDLSVDEQEQDNLLPSSDPEHIAALAKFQTVLDSLPERDARPAYHPRAANPWDRTDSP